MGAVNEQIHQMSQQTAGKIGLTVGGGGAVYDWLVELSGWTDLIIKYGTAILIIGSLYLTFYKILRKSDRRDRRDRAND